MKIYIDFNNFQITKKDSDVMFQGDVLSNAFELLFYNYSDTSWFPTMSQLAPNGRQAGDFAADPLEPGESQTVTIDGVTYLKYKFTIGPGWCLVKGKSNFFIWKNTATTPMTRKCIGRVMVTLNESTETYFIDDVEFNPKVKTYIDACVAEIGDGSPKYFDTAANIALLTEDKGLAVATDTGHLYYWDSTSTSTTKYTDSGLVYNDLSAYYTKTQSDNTFAPKSTAITHTGNQLQDYSGNNVYPNLDDGQVSEEKTSFMTEEIQLTNNLLLANSDNTNARADLLVNDDGSWTITCKNNAGRSFTIPLDLEAGTYTISSQNFPYDNSNDYGGIWVYEDSTLSNRLCTITINKNSNQSASFTLTSAKSIRIIYVAINSNISFNCFIQLEVGSIVTKWGKAYGKTLVNPSIKNYVDFNFYNKQQIDNFLNVDNLKKLYRYLVLTFYGSNSSGLILLGTNDLKTFDLISKRGIYTCTKTFGNNISNTLRDPAIIQIRDYYYIVYTIIAFDTGNVIGMCRTRDFVTFEELDNLVVSNGVDTYDKIWAPSWFRDGNNIYIVATAHVQNGNYTTTISRYDVANHSLGTATTITDVGSGIDYHMYHENGYYYLVGAGGKVYKSNSLTSNYTQVVNQLSTDYEADFCIKLDNGKWRIFRQQLQAQLGTAHMTYIDVDSLESPIGTPNDVIYTPDALTYISTISSVYPNAEYCHWTIFDFNNRNDNNNNFIS
jgi:hypothetical protein